MDDQIADAGQRCQGNAFNRLLTFDRESIDQRCCAGDAPKFHVRIATILQKQGVEQFLVLQTDNALVVGVSVVGIQIGGQFQNGDGRLRLLLFHQLVVPRLEVVRVPPKAPAAGWSGRTAMGQPRA